MEPVVDVPSVDVVSRLDLLPHRERRHLRDPWLQKGFKLLHKFWAKSACQTFRIHSPAYSCIGCCIRRFCAIALQRQADWQRPPASRLFCRCNFLERIVVGMRCRGASSFLNWRVTLWNGTLGHCYNMQSGETKSGKQGRRPRRSESDEKMGQSFRTVVPRVLDSLGKLGSAPRALPPAPLGEACKPVRRC